MSTEIEHVRDVLGSLIWDHEFRARFKDQREKMAGIQDAYRHLFAPIDFEELSGAAYSCAKYILSGNHDGGRAGLQHNYPQTLAQLEKAGHSKLEVVYTFMKSNAFKQHREVPFTGTGLCVEEAFYTFVLESSALLSAHADIHLLIHHEFAIALTNALSLSPRPDFTTNTQGLTHNKGVWYLRRTYPRAFVETWLEYEPQEDETRWVYAAMPQGTLCGPEDEIFGGHSTAHI